MNIEFIAPEHADGELREIYQRLGVSRGKIAKVHMAHSLNPKVLATHMEFYKATMFGESPLTRSEREMLAVVVSSSNECTYCLEHHAAALNHYWKNQARVQCVANDFRSADISKLERAFCALAESVTRNPKECLGAIKDIRSLGGTDRVIHDATNVASYFNYVNRIVLSLGVELEAEGPSGFTY
ncbi:MAG: peroxidase-related enzyme [Oligoflexales bacterium]